ncbi:hypothetical protein [Flavobacterium ajazii]|uniref:hypothetical protein n=1 Tax=Flavobacterium ajazii TaxID=2692318 RepID=UPI0013D3F68F|nr:hypothetical protein [Flavobacterium ajazii]
MKQKNVILLIILFFFATSFSIKKVPDVSLEKIWVLENYLNGVSTYKAKARFSKNKPGIEFKKDGSLKINQNSSWCGTEPIEYEIADGTWQKTNDSIIAFEHTYWGGTIKLRAKIIQLTKKKLVLKQIHK